VITFFALLLLVSVPFWYLGAVHPVELMPGLPIAALMAACPAVVAVALRWRQGGWAAARRLMLRALDHEKIRPRY
jgi:hypothetical protein